MSLKQTNKPTGVPTSMLESDDFNRSHEFYLSDISAKDKPWDEHRAQSDQVSDLYRGGQYDQYAERMDSCSNLLGFNYEVNPETGESKLKLNSARFCRVRHCPICQWRRSNMWRARFFDALPDILTDYPDSRYLFLTLTVRNCPVDELRQNLTWMNQSWQRLTQRKQFPALGCLRGTEVTRSIIGEAHPHFHAILMVNESYFKNRYLSQEKWIQLWRESARLDYDPSVRVKSIRIQSGQSDELDEQLVKSICESVKYSVKPQDLVADRQWLESITTQLHKTRAVSVSGVFKNYISEKEPEDLIGEDESIEDSSSNSVYFSWQQKVQRYVKTML